MDIDPKHPDENLPVNMDFAGALPSGVTISSVLWSAPGLTVTSPAVTGAVASAYLAGGVADQDYWVKATATLSTGGSLILEGRLKVRSRSTGPR